MTERVAGAIRLLAALSRNDGPMYAPDVARDAGVAPLFAAKILQELARLGLAESARGPRGCFWVEGAPTIAAVIAALDPRAAEVPFAGPYAKKVAAWRARTTVRDLAGPAAEGGRAA